MLQFLRSSAGSWVVKILFVLLIASFAVWGIGDVFRGQGPDTTVAEVGSFVISAEEVSQEFRRQLNQLRPVLGDNVSVEQARALGLLDQSLQGLIERALFQLAARDLELAVGTDMVRNRLQASPQFRNQMGQFDPDMFRRFLLSNGLTEAGYIQLLQEEAARELLMGAVLSGTAAPQPLTEALYRYRQEERIAETLFVSEAAMEDPGQPTDEQLQAYYEENAIAFTAPEYRAVTVASLSADLFEDRIELTEDEIRAEFDARPGDFVEPERRSVAQVVVSTRDAAEAILTAVRGGATLAEAAEAAGQEPPVLFERVAAADLPELADTAFSLTKGETGGPVESLFGWHVVTVTEIIPGGDASFETVRDRVADAMKQDLSIDRLYEVSNQFDDILASGATLESAAAELAVPLLTIPAVDADGTAPTGVAPEDAPAYLDQIVERAFDMREGEQSLLTETDDGAFFVVRLDSVINARQRPLDEVRDAAVEGWRLAERGARAEARARELVEAAETGTPLENLAETLGVTVGVTEPMTRVGAPKGRLSQSLHGRLFTLDVGDVVQGQVPGGRLVVRLQSVEAAEPAESGDRAMAAMEGRLTQEIAQDLLAQYVTGLRQSYDVTINRDALNAAF